ncbi:MAG: hypothetical protein AW09_001243 [Candidatus Accumulibacter phosphatis]|uniref:Uncharacterized protein n=1 Tax=Candidatus Accumulibacter phosphatis TaxID=327160 RepID=A0A080M8N9_9PROT|nr:MAG: hypothetical protein AW09_001243 [Candidatus Accumulibacter phosphatis]
MRQAERRQAAGDCSQRLQVGTQIQRPTGSDGGQHRDQSAGDFLRDALAADDDRQHGKCYRERIGIGFPDQPQVVHDLHERVVTDAGQTQQTGNLEQRHLHADSGQKAGEDGAREKIGEETEAHHPGKKHQGRCHQCEQAAQGEPLAGSLHRHAGQTGGDHRRRCRISTDREMPRRPENGEQAHREENGVQAGDHRRADDLGVTHGPRNRECG